MLASSSKGIVAATPLSQDVQAAPLRLFFPKGNSRGEGAAITSGDQPSESTARRGEGVAATFRQSYFPFARWVLLLLATSAFAQQSATVEEPARFLAGLPVEGPLESLSQTEAW